MSHILTIVLCGVLLFVAVEDFRFLGIRWPAFPFLFLLGIAFSLFQGNRFITILTNTGVNLMVVFVQYLGVVMYSYIKDRSAGTVNSKIGLGDFLFLLAVAPLFNPFSFVLFLVTSLFFTLIIILVRKASNEHIPLAGYLALFLIFELIIVKLLNFDLYSPILNIR